MVTEMRGAYANIKDFRGKSTDEKPTNCENGSTFYEMDTKKLFMYDGENTEWVEQNGD